MAYTVRSSYYTMFQTDAEALKLPQEAQEKLSENLTPS